MNDDPGQKPAAPVPTPQAFARTRPLESEVPGGAGHTPLTARENSERDAVVSRFPSTGDSRVDDAVAGLPDPTVHRQPAHAMGSTENAGHDEVGGEVSRPGEVGSPQSEGSLPDPALLDKHIGQVTATHRLLQQRLSDLSG